MTWMHDDVSFGYACKLCGWTRTFGNVDVESCVAHARQREEDRYHADIAHKCAGDSSPGGFYRDFFSSSVLQTKTRLKQYGGSL